MLWEEKYYFCISVKNCNLFCFLARFPSISSLFCLPFYFFCTISDPPVYLSLCSCFSPSSLSQAFLASLSSFPFTPSQDKQPLFWGMSAICSKKLTSFWMSFRSWSPKGGKITNLVLFHNLSLCFSFFLVYAIHFFPSSSLTSCTSLTWNSDSQICQFQHPVTFVLNLTFFLFQPVWLFVLIFLSCLLHADLSYVWNFHHSSPINTRGKNWTPVLMPLSSPCQAPLTVHTNIQHTLEWLCGKALPIWHLLIIELFVKSYFSVMTWSGRFSDDKDACKCVCVSVFIVGVRVVRLNQEHLKKFLYFFSSHTFPCVVCRNAVVLHVCLPAKLF